MRRIRLARRLIGILALSTVALQIAPAATAATATISALTVSGSPFAPALTPLPTSISIRLTLSAQARTKLLVTKLNGTVVARLIPRQTLAGGAYTRTWSGKDSAGALVPDGEYVIKAVATRSGITQTVTRRIRKGLPPIYPANPGAIVIAVDPGHGGRFAGAVNGEWQEKNFNLDISLKLRQLLVNAGVQVVITRTTDVAVLEPASDLNGDGTLNRYDDDLMRNDVKNSARADVAVHVHNNASSNASTSGTGTYIPEHRTWTEIARNLATGMVGQQYAALAAYNSATFTAKDHGVKYGRFYYYMAPYDPPFLPRPSLVTSVLSESLYVSNAAELEMLKRADVRTSLAAAIYIGLARWLNSRDLGIGYELISGPADPVAAGSSVDYRVKVTNRGNTASDDWTLELRNVAAVPEYDGSDQLGSLMGSLAVPDGLQPGASMELVVNATAPAGAGNWLVKADVQLADSSFASAHGVVVLQSALSTVTP